MKEKLCTVYVDEEQYQDNVRVIITSSNVNRAIYTCTDNGISLDNSKRIRTKFTPGNTGIAIDPPHLRTTPSNDLETTAATTAKDSTC